MKAAANPGADEDLHSEHILRWAQYTIEGYAELRQAARKNLCVFCVVFVVGELSFSTKVLKKM